MSLKVLENYLSFAFAALVHSALICIKPVCLFFLTYILRH